MVKSAIRKLKHGGSYGEDNMVKNISKALKCSIRQVKICLAVLKGDDKDIHVSKGMLEEAVKQKWKKRIL